MATGQGTWSPWLAHIMTKRVSENYQMVEGSLKTISP